MNEDAQQLKKASGWGMAWGFLTMLFGFMAIGSPFVSGLAVTVAIGIALLAAGVSMLIYSFQAPSLGRGTLLLSGTPSKRRWTRPAACAIHSHRAGSS